MRIRLYRFCTLNVVCFSLSVAVQAASPFSYCDEKFAQMKIQIMYLEFCCFPLCKRLACSRIVHKSMRIIVQFLYRELGFSLVG